MLRHLADLCCAFDSLRFLLLEVHCYLSTEAVLSTILWLCVVYSPVFVRTPSPCFVSLSICFSLFPTVADSLSIFENTAANRAAEPRQDQERQEVRDTTRIILAKDAILCHLCVSSSLVRAAFVERCPLLGLQNHITHTYRA